MKYDFYQLRDEARRGKPLPDDVNAFVAEKLVGMGFGAVIPRMDAKRKHLHFGELVIIDTKNPARRVELTFRYGMVQHFDMIEEAYTTDNILVVDKARIKNPFLNTNATRRKDQDNE